VALPSGLRESLGLGNLSRAKQMIETGASYLVQEDGESPTTLIAGSAPGESGVSVVSLRFRGGLHFSATTRQHLIWFASPVCIDCRIAGRTLRHEAPGGSLAICPAGSDCGADAEEGVDALLVAIDPGRFALAAAEGSALEARLNERLSDYDQGLLDLARSLTSESANDYPNGPLYWNQVASSFIDGLLGRHTSGSESRARGMLGKGALARLRDYVVAHLDEWIEVAALADIAGRSLFHFSRVFTRSVGMTPHRWVVHLRLHQAIELVREGRSGLAEIAARTGFADQSHLSRWVRRVHGVSLTQLDA
jgi:AraC family transcriptional regulator